VATVATADMVDTVGAADMEDAVDLADAVDTLDAADVVGVSDAVDMRGLGCVGSSGYSGHGGCVGRGRAALGSLGIWERTIGCL